MQDSMQVLNGMKLYVNCQVSEVDPCLESA